MRKSKSGIFIFLFVSIVVALSICFYFVNKNNKIEVMDAGFCKRVVLSNKYEAYSIDAGETWTSDNKYLICEDKELNVVARADGKVYNLGNVKVELNGENNFSVSFNNSGYTCNAGETVNGAILTSDLTNFSGELISSNNDIASVELDNENIIKCIGCTAIKIKCNKPGNTDLEAKTSNGAIARSIVVVKEDKVGSISYDKDNYTCEAGKEINAVITANSINSRATVKSFSSSNTNVATVEKNSSYSLKCINCLAVKIKCKSNGITTLSATSSTGAVGDAKVNVLSNNNNGNNGNTTVENPNTNDSVNNNGGNGGNNTTINETISYDKGSYSCEAGKNITATITVHSSNLESRVLSYSSSNNNIATVIKHPSMAVKCVNCVAVQINCKSEGKVNLYASSTYGATTQSSVTVTKNVGSVTFDKSSYTCKVGDSFVTEVKSGGYDGIGVGIDSFSSANGAIATIIDNPDSQPKCLGCRYAKITCKSRGTTTVRATSGAGVIGTATVTVS